MENKKAAPPLLEETAIQQRDQNTIIPPGKQEKVCICDLLWPYVQARREARKLLGAQLASVEVLP